MTQREPVKVSPVEARDIEICRLTIVNARLVSESCRSQALAVQAQAQMEINRLREDAAVSDGRVEDLTSEMVAKRAHALHGKDVPEWDIGVDGVVTMGGSPVYPQPPIEDEIDQDDTHSESVVRDEHPVSDPPN